MALSRRVLPIALVLAFQQALAAISTAWRSQVFDPDVFWVAAAGRDMLATHDVPRTNLWSFVDGAHPWTMHEWLFGPPYALGLRAFGPAFFLGVGIVFGIVIGLLVTGAFLADVRSNAVALGAALAVLFICDPRIGLARPTYAALVFPLALAILAFRPRFGNAHAAGAIAIAWVWANAHGSFPLGWIVLAAAFAETPNRPHAIAVVGAVLASFVNPYGLGLHRLVVDYALGRGSAAEAHAHVYEYAPIWRSEYHEVTPPLLLAASIACGLGAALLLARRRHVARAGLVLLFAIAGLLAARHVVLAPLVGTVVLAPAIDERITKADAVVRPLRLAVAVFAPALVLGLALLAIRAARTAPEDLLSPKLGGADVVALVHDVPDDTRVYTPFRSASLVIWEGAPRGIRIFYDSRNDCYSPEVARWQFAHNDEHAIAE
ncbi:MAG TPA: hypothetical protein VF407_01115, partial [Polyangiaceae bacterium]